MHKNVHSNPIQNSPDLESTQRVINSRMDKYIVMYSHNGILLALIMNDLQLFSITQIFTHKKLITE